jgi:hypothetical protein
MMRHSMIAATLVVVLIAPAAAGAQGIGQSRLGMAPAVSASRMVAPEVTAIHRRAGWEVGAALGALGGLAFGRFVVVMYNDGRAEKMSTGREVLTMVGAAAVGAGIGALIQKIVT